MMLRSRPFRHWMARLALAAVLLLALAPTVSRWVESSGQRLPGALLAMCTSGGMSLVKPASPWADGQGEQAPAGAAADEYCPHCPLLAKVTPLLLAIIALPLLRAEPPRVDADLPRYVAAFLPRGLGARGPPILF
jgi:hypothetical protein